MPLRLVDRISDLAFTASWRIPDAIHNQWSRLNPAAASLLLIALVSLENVAALGQPNNLEHIRKQAEQGDIDAEFALGLMYQGGKVRGVLQDYVEAARWYRMAADHGYYAAMHELGLMYFDGKGVPQDYVMAYMWLNLAAAYSPAGETNAAEARDNIAGQMTRAQILEGQQLARAWVPK